MNIRVYSAFERARNKGISDQLTTKATKENHVIWVEHEFTSRCLVKGIHVSIISTKSVHHLSTTRTLSSSTWHEQSDSYECERTYLLPLPQAIMALKQPLIMRYSIFSIDEPTSINRSAFEDLNTLTDEAEVKRQENARLLNSRHSIESRTLPSHDLRNL